MRRFKYSNKKYNAFFHFPREKGKCKKQAKKQNFTSNIKTKKGDRSLLKIK